MEKDFNEWLNHPSFQVLRENLIANSRDINKIFIKSKDIILQMLSCNNLKNINGLINTEILMFNPVFIPDLTFSESIPTDFKFSFEKLFDHEIEPNEELIRTILAYDATKVLAEALNHLSQKYLLNGQKEIYLLI